MKYFLLVWIFIPALTFAQVSGELATDGRKISGEFDFKITGHKAGLFVFNIGVDMEGIVKQCVLDATNSTIVSTPLMVKAKNHILANLKFERGYHFPEMHYGSVTIEVVLQQ